MGGEEEEEEEERALNAGLVHLKSLQLNGEAPVPSIIPFEMDKKKKDESLELTLNRARLI